MKCRKAQQLLSARFDGELDESRGRALNEHLAGCSRCRCFEGGLLRCAEALDSMKVLDARPDFTVRVLGRLPERRAKPAWLRDWLDGLPVGHTVAAVLALSCGVALALSMNGEQRSGVSVSKQPAEALYTESFNALPGDSAEARYLALFEEKEN